MGERRCNWWPMLRTAAGRRLARSAPIGGQRIPTPEVLSLYYSARRVLCPSCSLSAAFWLGLCSNRLMRKVDTPQPSYLYAAGAPTQPHCTAAKAKSPAGKIPAGLFNKCSPTRRANQNKELIASRIGTSLQHYPGGPQAGTGRAQGWWAAAGAGRQPMRRGPVRCGRSGRRAPPWRPLAGTGPQ